MSKLGTSPLYRKTALWTFVFVSLVFAIWLRDDAKRQSAPRQPGDVPAYHNRKSSHRVGWPFEEMRIDGVYKYNFPGDDWTHTKFSNRFAQSVNFSVFGIWWLAVVAAFYFLSKQKAIWRGVAVAIGAVVLMRGATELGAIDRIIQIAFDSGLRPGRTLKQLDWRFHLFVYSGCFAVSVLVVNGARVLISRIADRTSMKRLQKRG